MADKYTQDFIDEVKGCLNSGNNSSGGSGADEVARAAIEAHAGNSSVHLTAEQLNSAVSAHNTDSSAHAALFAAVKQTPKSFSISTSSWTTLTTAVAGRTYKATISASGVTTSDFPDVYFNSSSVVAATAADIVADTAANYVVLYAKTKPTATLSGSYFIRKGS